MSKSIAVFAGHYEDMWELKHSKGIYTDLEADGAYEEFDTNIIIARYTVNQLRKVPGLTVHFPQENGRDMKPLYERVDYCNDHKVDTAIFIHSNAAGRGASGACAFYWETSPEGEHFANLYREEMARFGFPLWSDGTYPCRLGTWSEFYVVQETEMPVILTENFFFTNPYELKTYLLNPTNRDKIIEAHVRAACRYLGVEIPKTKIQEIEEDEEMLEKAIVVNAFPDMTFAIPLANRLNAPIYVRSGLPAEKVAKELYVVGGTKDGLAGKADNYVMLTGATRFDVAHAVDAYLNK